MHVPSDMDEIGSKLEISPEGIPEWLLDDCDVAVYVMGESQVICDELACSDLDLGNTDSESESDDDGDQVDPGPRHGARLSPESRRVRNERERVRVSKINEKFKEAKALIMESTLIDDDSKKHRWTQLYSLKQTLKLLTIIEGKFKKYNRVPCMPRPFSEKTTPRRSPKPPNCFIQFSNALGPSILPILKTYLHPGKSKEELQRIQVSQRKLMSFLGTVWHRLGPEEKRRDWGALGPYEKERYVRLAEDILQRRVASSPAHL